MEDPTTSFDAQPGTGNTKLLLNILKVLAVLGVLLLLGLIAWRIILNLNFRMNGTSPKLSEVANIMPFIDAQFNRELGKGIKATGSEDIVTKTETHGKTLRIFLDTDDNPLEEGKSYTITIKGISSTKGDHLADQTLKFEAKTPDPDKMPKAQRDFLLKRQANKPASPDNIVLDNISDLQNQGLEPGQEQSFRSALFAFKPKAKTTRITSTVEAINPEEAQELGMQVYNFDMLIDKEKYKVKLECPELTAIRAIFTDQQGKQVFDSGVIDSEGGD